MALEKSIILFQLILIGGLIFYIINLKRDLNNESGLGVIEKSKANKNINFRMEILKRANGLYESMLNTDDLRKEGEDELILEYAFTNYQIGKIYQDNPDSIQDIKGTLFDSTNARMILRDNYFIKALDIFNKLNSCKFEAKADAKESFCEISQILTTKFKADKADSLVVKSILLQAKPCRELLCYENRNNEI